MKKIISIVSIFLFLLISITLTQVVYKPLKINDPPRLYFTQNLADLRRVTQGALARAKHRIDLRIYRLTDPSLLQNLIFKCHKGVHISVLYDPGGGPLKLPLQIEQKTEKINGLIHQKVLMIDDDEIWIGSANWTVESMAIHENVLVGIRSKELVETVRAGKPHHTFTVGGQRLEFWEQPDLASFERLMALLQQAQRQIYIAMYAFSHPQLAQALIDAHHRGVKVEVILDRQMCSSVNKKVFTELEAAQVFVTKYRGMGVLHDKLAWIDDSLVVGSTNWTRAAFSRNQDCYLILHDLSPIQKGQLKRFWRILKATTE